MPYLILFFGVMCFLTVVAWRFPEQPKVFARQAGRSGATPLHGAGPDRQGEDALRARIARLLAGERKEDKPCLTPVDCVQSGRCAGHCGCR